METLEFFGINLLRVSAGRVDSALFHLLYHRITDSNFTFKLSDSVLLCCALIDLAVMFRDCCRTLTP